MRALNDPAHQEFEPTIFSSVDFRDLSSRLHPVVYEYILKPYIKWAQSIARHPRVCIAISHLMFTLLLFPTHTNIFAVRGHSFVPSLKSSHKEFTDENVAM